MPVSPPPAFFLSSMLWVQSQKALVLSPVFGETSGALFTSLTALSGSHSSKVTSFETWTKPDGPNPVVYAQEPKKKWPYWSWMENRIEQLFEVLAILIFFLFFWSTSSSCLMWDSSLRVIVSNWDTAGVLKFSFLKKDHSICCTTKPRRCSLITNRTRYKVKRTLVPKTSDNNDVLHADFMWRAESEGNIFVHSFIFVTAVSNSSKPFTSSEQNRD